MVQNFSVDPEVASELFGQTGKVYAELIDDVIKNILGTSYQFVDSDDDLKRRPMFEQNRIKCRNLLYSCHFAAASNILRQQRWFKACCTEFSSDGGNYAGFAACLRSLIEASGDAFYALRAVPANLSQLYVIVRDCLARKEDTALPASIEEVINLMDHANRHFSFGEKAPDEKSIRKNIDQKKKARQPDASAAAIFMDRYDHPEMARQPWEYITDSKIPGGKDLYGELCGIVHPTASSVLWMFESGPNPNSYCLRGGNDRTEILDLCERRTEAISLYLQESFNSSLLILKLLNEFSLNEISTKGILESRDVPGWAMECERLQAAMRQ
ncbi:MAG: hypothetical protein K2W95_17610 [Candidatus Obscuribacterales bacterium]|nr:hypothetical protein [Candidatus Obscuribacterales bacterium]